MPIPQFMKHFSVGASLGICVGAGFSLFMSHRFMVITLIVYLVLFCVGFINIKNDFIDWAK